MHKMRQTPPREGTAECALYPDDMLDRELLPHGLAERKMPLKERVQRSTVDRVDTIQHLGVSVAVCEIQLDDFVRACESRYRGVTELPQ